MKILSLMLIAAFCAPMLFAAERTDPAKTKKEYGAIRWYTNLDDAIKLAKESGKPIFLQFQEIPG